MLSSLNTILVIVSALLLDHLLGEPRRGHPLVGFGRLATFVESRLNNPAGTTNLKHKLVGLFAVGLLIFPFTGVIVILLQTTNLDTSIAIVVLYLAIGRRSLIDHANRVQDSLKNKKTAMARKYTGHLVSRDTTNMNNTDMAKATIESVLENGCDAIFAVLFWFVLAGVPGVVLYRLTNTLDAMWGYRNRRYRYFGWAAARLDDGLNYLPARLTALTYALVGKFNHAIHCWRTQGPHWQSPNAGPVMAAGAGALALRLGGPAVYHGKLRNRPILGTGQDPNALDIEHALSLLQRGICLWVVSIAVVYGVTYLA